MESNEGEIIHFPRGGRETFDEIMTLQRIAREEAGRTCNIPEQDAEIKMSDSPLLRTLVATALRQQSKPGQK